MDIVKYSDFGEKYLPKVQEWCCEIQEENTPAVKNMSIEDWQNKPETLLYILYNKTRFHNTGEFFFLEENGKIIAASGVYESDFDKNIVLAGTRTFVNLEHRSKFLVARYLLPEQMRWSKERSYKIAALCFNEYNKNMVNMFLKNGFGVVKNRTSDMMFYDNIQKVNFPVSIQYTPQWVVYYKIDKNYEYDWSKIKWK
jgi:hypothetical protein